jgi:hypothetical protein
VTFAGTPKLMILTWTLALQVDQCQSSAVTQQTPIRYQLIEARLGRPLVDYVAEALSSGKGWRPIAQEITERTQVRVSYEMLRRWMTGRLKVETKVVAR